VSAAAPYSSAGAAAAMPVSLTTYAIAAASETTMATPRHAGAAASPRPIAPGCRIAAHSTTGSPRSGIADTG